MLFRYTYILIISIFQRERLLPPCSYSGKLMDVVISKSNDKHVILGTHILNNTLENLHFLSIKLKSMTFHTDIQCPETLFH